MSDENPILVTGAAGKVGAVGRTIVEMLRKRNMPVRALVRRRDERAKALGAMGAEVVVGDLTRGVDVARALEGCQRLYFGMSVSPPYLEATVIAAAAARERGDLEAFVNISQMTVSQMSLTNMTNSPQQRQHWLAEQVLDWFGLPVVHVRATVFLEHFFFSEWAASSIAKEGTIRLPFGSGRTSPVAVRDVAAVIATVLESPSSHIGKVYERPCCTERKAEALSPWPHPVSSDPNGDRASEREHAVQGVHSNGDFGILAPRRPRPESIADHPLVPADRRFDQSPPIVTTRLLPAHAAALRNLLKMPIPLRRSRVRRLTEHGRRARRHDDRGVRMAFGNDAVDVLPVIGAITRKRSDRTRDLIEQRADLRTVVDIVGGQFRGHDLASADIHADVQLAPRTSRLAAMFLDQPLAGAAQLQACAVHQQMHRFGFRTRLPEYLHGLGSPAQRRMIGNGEIKTEQADDGPDQPLGLAQSQAEDGTQGQCCHDRQRRIARLTARRRARRRLPGRDRRLSKPEGQTSALTQGGVILRPVCNPAPLLGNMVTAVLVGFERHGHFPGQGRDWPPIPTDFYRPTGRPTGVRATRSRQIIAVTTTASRSVPNYPGYNCPARHPMSQ